MEAAGEARGDSAEKGQPAWGRAAGSRSFFSLVSPHLDAVGDFVRHEVGYAEATGDLIRGEVTAEDITDAALLRAYHEFIKDPARGDVRSWLLKLAVEQLEKVIKRSRWERTRTVRIEEDIPETPPAQEVSTLGDEILDFYQPDEDLKLEDVVPDIHIPSPEQEVETKELRRCVRAALGAMPREWRRLLILRYVQGLRHAELARATGVPETEIDRSLEHARATLRQKLIESGCSIKSSSAQTAGREESVPAAR
jgi:RNA polymerase sigma factor (sigma-70 family)